MRVPALAWLGCLTIAATGWMPAPHVAQTQHTLVPFLGHWRNGVEQGRPTITMDGQIPPSPPNVDGAAGLFGAAGATFLESVSGPDAFPLAVARDVTEFRQGRLRVQFKLIAGVSDRAAGLVFNLRADGGYNVARYSLKAGNVAIGRVGKGARSVLTHGETQEPLAAGHWHTLAVTIQGHSVTVTVNGRLPLAHTFAQPVLGRVGLWTEADSVTAFRSFAVERR